MWEAESSTYWEKRERKGYGKGTIAIGIISVLVLTIGGYLYLTRTSTNTTIKPLDEEARRQLKELSIKKAESNCQSLCYSEGDAPMCGESCTDYLLVTPRSEESLLQPHNCLSLPSYAYNISQALSIHHELIVTLISFCLSLLLFFLSVITWPIYVSIGLLYIIYVPKDVRVTD